MKTKPLNFEYSTLPQRRALASGRRVFERSGCDRLSELEIIHPDGGETWVYRGDLAGTVHNASERRLRRVYPGCLISRK